MGLAAVAAVPASGVGRAAAVRSVGSSLMMVGVGVPRWSVAARRGCSTSAAGRGSFTLAARGVGESGWESTWVPPSGMRAGLGSKLEWLV